MLTYSAPEALQRMAKQPGTTLSCVSSTLPLLSVRLQGFAPVGRQREPGPKR
jgi:hypothetical protein